MYMLIVTIVCMAGLWKEVSVVAKPQPQPQQKIKAASEITDPEHVCLYENKTYHAGEKFRPDSCTFCHCPRHGGEARCAVQDCFFNPSCIKFDNDPNECCQRCLEYGCQHHDGKFYPPGAVISNSPCETCRCPRNGGRTQCIKQGCPPVLCVDAIHKDGECCPICPNGPNCWLDGEIIEAGIKVPKDTCKLCECPASKGPHWTHGKHRRAICSMDKCD
ncbi:unnamed protein product [Owenia fusiformis]|uniref:Uncharacterized protein n=1 Tax=Owenia fusiformis TaxID=6347 RepID=A0A8J1XYN1_OWEFU|nr:unnamed protein product [Owenia fusiformis]